VKKVRVLIIKMICRLLLPKNVFVGKHFGAYTQKYDIVFGVLDNRGVLQGVLPKDITLPQGGKENP
jgi:hypothetical protein